MPATIEAIWVYAGVRQGRGTPMVDAWCVDLKKPKELRYFKHTAKHAIGCLYKVITDKENAVLSNNLQAMGQANVPPDTLALWRGESDAVILIVKAKRYDKKLQEDNGLAAEVLKLRRLYQSLTFQVDRAALEVAILNALRVHKIGGK